MSAGDKLRGTVQNDVLKEYVARGNYIFPPRPSMRLTTDLFAYCQERLPRWNTISISGYHIREAGASAAQELAFTLSNGIAYCEAAIAAGLSPDQFGERLSFFFNAHNHFFQEVAKFRVARRLWAEIMSERFGATNPRARALRFHAQTGGSTLTAQQPENNIVRVAIQALSAVCGGAQSIHTNSFDEALALPSERAARIALRTQQILAHEAGGTDTADPLGGAYFIEALTNELEEKTRELIQRVDELGGAVAAIEQGFVQAEIEASAFRYQAEVESGERLVVGVNRFTEEGEERVELLQVDPESERPPEGADKLGSRRAGRRGSGECAGRGPKHGRDRREPPPADARGASRALHRRRDLRRSPRAVGITTVHMAVGMHKATQIAAAAAVVLALGIPLAALAGSRDGASSATPAASPSFTRDVAPIIQQKCAGCHQIGGIAPVAFDTAKQISSRSTLIAATVQAGLMPPWPPGARSPSYVGEQGAQVERLPNGRRSSPGHAPEADRRPGAKAAPGEARPGRAG